MNSGTSYHLLYLLKAMHHVSSTDRKALTQELKYRKELLLLLLLGYHNVWLIVTFLL